VTYLLRTPRKPVHRPVLTPEEAARVERRRDEIELERLEEQLSALQADIGAARAAGRRAGSPALDFARKPGHPAPPTHGERVRLPDGHEILVRPVEPTDAPLLKEGFAHLGAVSRFRRFLEAVDELDAQDLRFLTDVDHTRHEAYVAIDPATGDGVGIARYVCGEAADAEAAIVVLDSWQHRGVGDMLADRLADAAVANGVKHFTGGMIVGNEAAERLLLRVGEPVERLRGPGTVELTVRLHRPQGVGCRR